MIDSYGILVKMKRGAYLLIVIDEIITEDIPALRSSLTVTPQSRLDVSIGVKILGHLDRYQVFFGPSEVLKNVFDIV